MFICIVRFIFHIHKLIYLTIHICALDVIKGVCISLCIHTVEDLHMKHVCVTEGELLVVWDINADK